VVVGGVEVHEIQGMSVVRLVDIQALPIWAEFRPWILGQTTLYYAGESWVYRHDWERFLRGESSWH
jgi:hypothetical protein